MLNRRQAVLGRENSGVQTDFDFEEQITQEVQTEVTHEEFALPLYIPSTVVEEKGIQTEETEGGDNFKYSNGLKSNAGEPILHTTQKEFLTGTSKNDEMPKKKQTKNSQFTHDQTRYQKNEYIDSKVFVNDDLNLIERNDVKNTHSSMNLERRNKLKEKLDMNLAKIVIQEAKAEVINNLGKQGYCSDPEC